MRTSVWLRCTIASLAVVGLVSCSNSGNEVSTKGDGTGSTETEAVVAVDQPGVTDTEIRVGGVASVTNPLGGPAGSAFDGVQAYFDMVNEAGGVHGRDLVLVSKRDDKLAENDAQVQALLQEDDVFAVLPIATYLFTAASKLVSSGVPTFGWNISPEWAGTEAEPRANLFGHSGGYQAGKLQLLPYTAMQTDTHKLGLLSYTGGATKLCTDAAEAAVEAYGAEAGLEIAFTDSAISYGVTDLAVQVTRMKEAGVDIIYPCLDFQGTVTLAKDRKKQGLDAVMLMPNSYTPDLTAEFSDLFQDDFTFNFFAPFETEDPGPGLQSFLEQMEDADYDVNENAVVGWINAAQFVAGLEAAGADFTQEKVVDAINQMTDFDADGVVIPIDWTTRHFSIPEFCAAVSRVEEDAFVPAFTQPGKPFICWQTDTASVQDFTNQ